MNAFHRTGLHRAGIITAAALFGLVQISAAGATAAEPRAAKTRLSAIVSSDGSQSGIAPAAATSMVSSSKGASLPADLKATANASDGKGVGIDSIIGTDDRYQVNPGVYPGTSTVLVTFSGGGRCTGWMAGYNPANLASTIVTAGHCVHTGGSGGAWRSGVTVYPGYPNTGFGCSAITLYSVVGWTTNGSPDYDYGAIKVNCTFSGQA
ncbi:trypsin-like serine peptidase, partial [Allorhizocola rhizosphaerae]|uniref:trypsin-like serine peptidase n=1 Tax=Allorhizocola rhizosphaerae TaxID=1872709 RepID=UPI003CCC6A9C